LIYTLPITIILEGLVIIGYCKRSGKPLLPILVTSMIANILTQSMLWAGLTVFYQDYVVVSGIAEVLIWLVESFLLSLPPKNELKLSDALRISLVMNLVSFGVGCFLPV
jgi:hypothetical protein